MAKSPSHKFGQIIGDLLEDAVEPILREFATKYSMYLDKKGSRPARAGEKVTWTDLFGNKHDLDFVLERGGTMTKAGEPLVFVETAWRRYTKHSKNKAQEIEGAVLPLVTTHRKLSPFIGVILAGEFTSTSLTQLRSRGFKVLHFSYSSVVNAFASVGIDANFGETTTDAEFLNKIQLWENLDLSKKTSVATRLTHLNESSVEEFRLALERFINRQIDLISVLPLHGKEYSFHTVGESIAFIRDYNNNDGLGPVVRYEVNIRYNNGDKIEGQFADKEDAMEFLTAYQPPSLRLRT